MNTTTFEEQKRKINKNKNLRESIFDLNIELLLSNPIQRSVFIGMVAIETLILLAVPIIMIRSKEYSAHIQEQANTIDNPGYIVTLLILAGITLLVFITYITLLIISKFNLIQSNHKNDKMMSIIHKILMAAFIVHHVLLKVPVSIFVQQELRNYISAHDQKAVLYVLPSLLAFIVDKLLAYIFNNFLTIPLPFEKLPWSRSKIKYPNLFVAQKPLLALCYITPMKWRYSPVAYSILIAISLTVILSNIRRIGSYNQTYQYFLIAQNTLILSTGIFLLINNTDYQHALLIIFVIVLVSGFLALQQINSFLLRKRVCLTTDSHSLNSNFDYIESLMLIGDSKRLQSVDTLKETFTLLLVIARKHNQSCENQACKCQSKKFQRQFLERSLSLKNEEHHQQLSSVIQEMKLRIQKQVITLGQLALDQQYSLSTKKKSTINKLEYLQMQIIKYRLENKNQSLVCYHQLIKTHNCKYCTINNCFLYQFLKQVITSNYKRQSNSHHNFAKFDSYISYENYFRSFCQDIDYLNAMVKNYWKNHLKREKNKQGKSKQTQGLDILNHYKNFSDKYKQITKECGNFVNVVLLTWRLFRDTLNFEEECADTFELLQNLLSKKKITNMLQFKTNAEGYIDETIDSTMMIILMSGNPSNIQQILNINKQFAKYTQYDDEELLGRSLTLILPQIIDQSHEKFVQNYIMNKKQDITQLHKSNLLMKTKRGAVISTDLKIQVNITHEQGIVFLGILRPTSLFNIDDKEHQINDVYFLLTDSYDKILHFSQNCIENLNFKLQLLGKDIQIQDIFPFLRSMEQDDEDKMLNEGLILDMNFQVLNLCDSHTDQHNLSYNKGLPVKMFLKINDCGHGQILKEYFFIIESDLGSIETRGNLMTQGLYEESKSQSIDESLPMKSDEFHQMSISSASSSSSMQSLSYQKINEIKSPMEFVKLPSGLNRFKRIVIFVFVLVICSAITLLIVNLKSKSSYQLDITALKNQKLMKNHFSLSRLSLLMQYGFAQIPDNNWQNLTFEIGLTSQEQVYSFLQSNLSKYENSLHDLLSEFSQFQSQWDPRFANLIAKDQIDFQSVSNDGNIYTQSATFFNILQKYLIKADSFADLPLNEATLQGIDPFLLLQQFENFFKSADYSNKRNVADFMFCLLNGESSIYDQLQLIDKGFMKEIMIKGNSVIRMLLTFTLVICALIVIVTSFLVPFVLDVSLIQSQVQQFVSKVKSPVIQAQIQKISEFEDYVINNKYLADSYQENKQKTLSQIQTILYATQKSTFSKLNDTQDQQIQKNNKIANEQQWQYPQANIAEIMASESGNEEEDMTKKNKKHKHRKSKREIRRKSYRIPISKRIYKSLIILVITVPLCAFYVVCYYLSSTILNNLQIGYSAYEVFYNRIPCVSNSLFYLQNSIFFNQSLQQNSTYGLKLAQVLDSCNENERNYKDVKYNVGSMFNGLQSYLDDQDGPYFCQFLGKIGINKEHCPEIHGGYLLIPSDNMIQSILIHIQNQINKFNSITNATTTQLAQLFYNQLTIDYLFLQFKYIINVFSYIQDVAHSFFLKALDRVFQVIISVFIVFMVLLFIFIFIVQKKVILRFKSDLLIIKILLKLIPSDEILKMRDQLTGINLKLL